MYLSTLNMSCANNVILMVFEKKMHLTSGCFSSLPQSAVLSKIIQGNQDQGLACDSSEATCLLPFVRFLVISFSRDRAKKQLRRIKRTIRRARGLGQTAGRTREETRRPTTHRRLHEFFLRAKINSSISS